MTGVWSGAEVMVYGGQYHALGIPLHVVSDEMRYLPSSDKWMEMGSNGGDGPGKRAFATSVWTGGAMLVWGGNGGPALNGAHTFVATDVGGAAYDPVLDAWKAIIELGAPAKRTDHTAVWTGSSMLVWGGAVGPGTALGDGGRYDPVADAWSPVSATDAPAARLRHVSVWMGSRMFVWGGEDASGTPLGNGGLYDPASDIWTAVATAGAPSPRVRASAVWTGSRVLVWGGDLTSSAGGAYDPITDLWTPITGAGAPAPRQTHAAVWTGSRMIIWGGTPKDAPWMDGLNTGGLYDPTLDKWQPTSTCKTAWGAKSFVAAWTGKGMFVFGGGPSAGIFTPP